MSAVDELMAHQLTLLMARPGDAVLDALPVDLADPDSIDAYIHDWTSKSPSRLVGIEVHREGEPGAPDLVEGQVLGETRLALNDGRAVTGAELAEMLERSRGLSLLKVTGARVPVPEQQASADGGIVDRIDEMVGQSRNDPEAGQFGID